MALSHRALLRAIRPNTPLLNTSHATDRDNNTPHVTSAIVATANRDADNIADIENASRPQTLIRHAECRQPILSTPRYCRRHRHCLPEWPTFTPAAESVGAWSRIRCRRRRQRSLTANTSRHYQSATPNVAHQYAGHRFVMLCHVTPKLPPCRQPLRL